jgi:hypothetical protein
VIKSAVAYFTAFSRRANMFVNVDCHFSAEDNAAAPSSLVELDALTLTSAHTSWSRVNVWSQNVEYLSPDLTGALQEIIDRPGWRAGYNLLLVLEDNGSTVGAIRDFFSIRNGALKRSKLCVEWDEWATTTTTTSSSTTTTSSTMTTTSTIPGICFEPAVGGDDGYYHDGTFDNSSEVLVMGG